MMMIPRMWSKLTRKAVTRMILIENDAAGFVKEAKRILFSFHRYLLPSCSNQRSISENIGQQGNWEERQVPRMTPRLIAPSILFFEPKHKPQRDCSTPLDSILGPDGFKES